MNYDPKAKIVGALREAGYNQRQVSVREDGGSLEWSFYLTIRDPSVNFKEVEQIAKNCQDISYDSASGEILGGGNTFVFVRVADEVIDAWAKKYTTKVALAIERLKALDPDDYSGVDIGPACLTFENSSRYTLGLWDNLNSRWYKHGFSLTSIRSISAAIYRLEMENSVPLF